ncbi:MAG: patatin-like phospholipase family protein [Chitinophagaceae bacterium]|nr:patatin-like phospholipase family protein [Chitinophagaceae bacterium]
MKRKAIQSWFSGLLYSFPVQLVFLHFRKYQILLLFWFILFTTVNSSFMHGFGADSLYLAPEYLGDVNAVASAIVGMAFGMFIMSWNITTFILFSRQFQFLAATTNPFLKYCINNSLIPIFFLVFYFFKAYSFGRYKELFSTNEILFLTGGFLFGLVLMLAASFAYFFGADRTIFKRLQPIINNPKEYIQSIKPVAREVSDDSLMRVKSFLNTPLSPAKPRKVGHYTRQYIDTVFKQHHFAAVLSVFIAFLFLILIGFFLEVRLFQIPAAASITVAFAILIGLSGAFTYFLQSWSIPYLLLLVVILNIFYQKNWIDPRNKAYGLNYQNNTERPVYGQETLRQLASPANITADSLQMIGKLEKWKARQKEEKPVFTILCTSGGGTRSATFTLSTLQQLDSLTAGEIMRNTFLITGSSGGMIGATYFRELYRQRELGSPIKVQDSRYVDDIARDLLNPLFSSFVARDLVSPAHKFKVGPYTYAKDRAYAFENKLDENTHGFLNKQLGDYKEDEDNARIPLIFFNSVITRDSRKLVASTQPVRFMMQPLQDSLRVPRLEPDALDFVSFFAQQDPYNLRILTALRMNATFPVVLPNVWLPSKPVIDVMDAGLRDNYGQETALRFLTFFDDWLQKNTRGVMIIQIRDRKPGSWDYPFESENVTDHLTKPFLLLQHNWYKMMEFSQNDVLSYYAAQHPGAVKINFLYTSAKEDSKAALNFHLTRREKADILQSIRSPYNRENFLRVKEVLTKPKPDK